MNQSVLLGVGVGAFILGLIVGHAPTPLPATTTTTATITTVPAQSADDARAETAMIDFFKKSPNGRAEALAAAGGYPLAKCEENFVTPGGQSPCQVTELRYATKDGGRVTWQVAGADEVKPAQTACIMIGTYNEKHVWESLLTCEKEVMGFKVYPAWKFLPLTKKWDFVGNLS